MDVPMRGVGGATPIVSNLQESWSKVSHAARELTTLFSVTFLGNNSSWSIGQNAPLKRRCLGTALERIHTFYKNILFFAEPQYS